MKHIYKIHKKSVILHKIKKIIMKISILNYIIVFSIIIISLSSCIENPEYPVIPEIKFKDFQIMKSQQGKDSLGILIFTFTDGDGDIGLDESDTFPPFNSESEYYYNFYLYFVEYNDNGDSIKQIEPPYTARIPRINRYSESVKGEIYVEIDVYFLPLVVQYHNINMRFFIYDRALNKSNVERTPIYKFNF